MLNQTKGRQNNSYFEDKYILLYFCFVLFNISLIIYN